MFKNISLVAPATLALFSASAGAQTLAEDFTKATIKNNWVVRGTPGACLTAGTATNNSTAAAKTAANYSSIPGCNLPTPDAVGNGALRLTKATTNQSGAIVWNDTFPTDKGLQVTFTTYTYGGVGGHQGADGMSFFLMDGAELPNVGAFGGSLGYSCSNGNGNGDGLRGAYLGLGIDEFGNFLNDSDNTHTGVPYAAAGGPRGGNSFRELVPTPRPNFQANRIGLRGAGNVSWDWLHAKYPEYYPAGATDAERATLVKSTCRTGQLYRKDARGRITAVSPVRNTMNYPVITNGYWILPDSEKIATMGAGTTRATATPITYRLMITPAGLLNFMYSYKGAPYKAVLTNHRITDDNGPLPSSFRFGFAGATGGFTNNHEIACFVAEPTESTSSAGANTVQAGQVRTGTQVYLASFNPNNWTGSLVSADLVNTGGVLSVASNYNWDLNCKLTGGGCASMGTTGGKPTHTVTVQAPAARRLITHDGAKGIALNWDDLSDEQKAVLRTGGAVPDTEEVGKDRLNWLRGDRSKEQTAATPGLLRARGGVLGDIVDSSPTWVGPPSMNYGTGIRDALYGTAGTESSYTDFANTMATRTNVVYAGSNGGFLHGARAGSNTATGVYDPATNDGAEVIAFMPRSVLASSKVVDLTKPVYGHEYFVDAAPGTGDVFYGGAWHTWLVGGLGAGGKEIYALEVTDPAQFSVAKPDSIVKGSWGAAELAELGYTYGTPLIRRMHNGNWAIIFGNGIGSANHLGGVYIGILDRTTGAVTFKWISTGVGSAGTPNGITNVSSGDLDGDRVIDYLYAGDLLGNVWRIDVTSSNSADWHVSKYGTSAATPLFTAVNGSGTRQPITTKLAVASVLTGNARRVIVGFGTGRSTPFTNTTATTYATGTQTVYGIWDWDMNAWNTGTSTPSGLAIPGAPNDFATLASTAESPRTISRTALSATSLSTSSSATTRELVINEVCWLGSTACATGNDKYGWRFDLPGTNEQLIYNPIFTDGVLALNTTIPPADTIGQCTPSLPTGWTMAFKMGSGGGAKQNFFPNASGSLAVETGHDSIVGVMQDAVGTPYVVTVGSNRYIVNQTTGGQPKVNRLNPQGGVSVKRVSVEQLR